MHALFAWMKPQSTQERGREVIESKRKHVGFDMYTRAIV